MSKTATVFFDGQILRPEGPLEMEPNKKYKITYEIDPVPEQGKSVWDLLEELAGTVEAPPDWSEEHDYYIHGTPTCLRRRCGE